MQLIRELERAPKPPAGCAVTIGAFDGVHRGHQAVIRRVHELADERGLATALVTFDRHPAHVVRPQSAPPLLTTLEQKIELLDATGLLDYLCVLTFDDARRQETAADFVRDILVDCLHARAVIVGEDFHFGFQRQGNVPLLRTLGADLGFEVVGLSLVPVDEGDGVFSSTLVREVLAAGDVARAAHLLGRPHEVRGPVVAGEGIGRQIGFPTARVAVDPAICLPAPGIYAATLTTPDGAVRPAAAYRGRRPTFDAGDEDVVEAYVLDFDGDLYGQPVRLAFVARIRADQQFDSVDEVVAQMARDVDDVRRLLDGTAP